MPLGLIAENLKKLNNWSLEMNSIAREFTFKDFKEALEFVNKVGEIAEERQHHPDILLTYGKVRISSTTHSEGGLTSKDFELAQEIDKL